jgi:hypothetical protein
MNGPLSTLEQRLDDALHERADAMPARTDSLPVPMAEPRRPPRSPLVWAVAAAAVVLAVATLVITSPFASDSGPATPTPSTVSPPTTTLPSTSTTTLPSTSTTMPIAAPPADAGAEVPLARADTENTQFLIRMQQRQNPNLTTVPVAVVSPGLAPIVVTGACMMIAVAPTDGTGYQGSCASDPATNLVAMIDTGANLTPTSKVYGAWVAVPDGTAYVTYSYGAERWWQRPLDGITYLATDASPKYGGEPLVARAFDASGRQLGEITQTPIRAGGEWDWY